MRFIKTIITTLLTIWLVGAVVMEIYYDIERKSTCIRQEGFWKGWLWCSTDPKTSFEFSFQRAYFFLKGLAWPIKIFQTGNEQVKGSIQRSVWVVQRNEAKIDLVKKNEAGEPIHSILLMNYNPSMGCRPELSALSIRGNTLGAPVRQDRQSSILTLAVGETSSSQFNAVKTDYSNGFEFAVLLDAEMMEKMRRGRSVQVETGALGWSTTFPLDKFDVANESARISCTKT